MTATPAVSVIIATRNRVELLREAVASVERQTLADWELIVVDDQSSDDTEAWVASHPDERVKLIALDRHRERSEARNRGLAAATGRYVLFLDDDDWLRVSALEDLASVLDADPGAVASVGGYALADGSGGRRRGAHPHRTIRRGLWRDALFEWVAPQGRSLFRTDVLRTVGGFPGHLTFAEDRDLWLRVARAGAAISIPKVVVDYRMHPGQRAFDDGLDAIEDVLRDHEKVLREDERTIARRMTAVRRSHREGSRALTALDGRRAFRAFVAAIRTDPWVLTSPFVRPQVLRPMGKSLVCIVAGRRAMAAFRRAAAWARRTTKRNVWSSTGDGSA